jgi:O-antigen ligase
VGICGARGAVLGFAAAVAAMVAARGGRFVFIGVGIAVVIIFAAIGLMRLTQPERLDNSLAMRDGRWPIWQTSLQMIADQPLLGTGGPKNFKETYLRAYPQVVKDIPNEFPGGAPHAHNTQLSLSAEYGIPFALAWLIMLFVPLGHLYRGNPEIFRAGLGIVVMVLIFGQFEKLDGAASRVLWTSLGMLLSLRHQPSASPTIS